MNATIIKIKDRTFVSAADLARDWQEKKLALLKAEEEFQKVKEAAEKAADEAGADGIIDPEDETKKAWRGICAGRSGPTAEGLALLKEKGMMRKGADYIRWNDWVKA